MREFYEERLPLSERISFYQKYLEGNGDDKKDSKSTFEDLKFESKKTNLFNGALMEEPRVQALINKEETVQYEDLFKVLPPNSLNAPCRSLA